jgi:hypothetical protein
MKKEEIAQWVINNRYAKSENDKVSDSEMYYFIVDEINNKTKELKEQLAEKEKEIEQLKTVSIYKQIVIKSNYCNCSEPKIYRKWGEIGCDKCNKLINPIKD